MRTRSSLAKVFSRLDPTRSIAAAFVVAWAVPMIGGCASCSGIERESAWIRLSDLSGLEGWYRNADVTGEDSEPPLWYLVGTRDRSQASRRHEVRLLAQGDGTLLIQKHSQAGVTDEIEVRGSLVDGLFVVDQAHFGGLFPLLWGVGSTCFRLGLSDTRNLIVDHAATGYLMIGVVPIWPTAIQARTRQFERIK